MGDKVQAWPREPFHADDAEWRSYERARYEAAMARLRVAVKWIKEHAKHDESGGRCYGLVRGRYVGDPPDMVYEEHTCKCGLDALKATIGELPPDPTEGG